MACCTPLLKANAIHACTHTYAFNYISTHILTHTHFFDKWHVQQSCTQPITTLTHTHVYTHTNIWIHTCICTHVHINTCESNTHYLGQMARCATLLTRYHYTHIHHVYVYTQKHINTCIHTYTHHTHITWTNGTLHDPSNTQPAKAGVLSIQSHCQIFLTSQFATQFTRKIDCRADIWEMSSTFNEPISKTRCIRKSSKVASVCMLHLFVLIW